MVVGTRSRAVEMPLTWADDDSEFDADEGGLGNAQITADAAAPAPRRTLRSSTQLPVVPAATKEPLLRGARSAGSLLFAGI